MRRSVSADAALEMDPVPMSAVHLPYKALAVDGRYPGDPDYPLYRRSLVRFEPVDRKELPDRFRGEGSVSAALAAWFAQAEKNTPPPKPPERIRIGGVGDLMVARGVQEMLIGKGAAGRKKVFGDTLPLLRDQDLLLGNLEGAVTARGTPTPKSYNFRFRPEVLPELKAAGFDYLSLTNNHCWDYGRSGFLDTLSHFKRYEVPTSGAGRSPEEARRPTEFRLSGRTVRVLSVAAYPQEKNGFDGRTQASVTSDRPGILFSGPEALEAVRSFSGDDSIDVVMVHGGQEWQDRPTAEQQRFYRSLVDAGANLVLGSHPHVLQGLESSSDGLIAYSLGNFVFPGMYVIPRAEETLLLSVVFYRDRPLYVEAYPIRISHRVLTRAEESGILDRFEGLTEELNG
jgi:poly-gamma-glutamate synthesis protein (capsule biosynthesis protein)